MSSSLEQQIAGIQPGGHICSIDEDQAEQLTITAAFVQAGLARGQRCVHVVEDRTLDEVRQALAAAGVDVPREQERGALRFLTKRDAYLQSGEFHPEAMLEFLRREEAQALEDGYSGLWISAEMTWALGREPGCDRLIEYEALLDQMTERRRSVILCQYDDRLFERPCIHDVIRTHSGGVLRPDTIVTDRSALAGGGRHELYRLLMENTHDVVSLSDIEGRRVYVSPSARRLLGWVPTGPFDGVHPEDLPIVRRAWQRFVAGERAVITYRCAHADGPWRWLESSGSLVQFRGRPHVLAVSRDVTERKVAEDALREREEFLRLLTDNSPEFIRVFDRAGKLVYANPAVERLMGEVPADFRGFPHPDDLELCLRWFERVLGGSRDLVQWRVRTSSNESRVMETQGCVVGYRGRPHVLTICRDVTERKQAEDEVRRQREVLQTIFDNVPVALVLFSPDGRLVLANSAWERSMGWTLRELEEQKLDAFAEGIPDPAERERIRQVVEAGTGEQTDLQMRTRDGSTINVSKAVVRLSDGTRIGMALDITERKRAEAALRNNEELLQSVLATLPVGVVVTDLAGNIVLANVASQRIWGELIVLGDERWARSKGWWHDSGERIEAESWASARALREGRNTLNELIDIETFDGQKKTIQNSAAPIRNAAGRVLSAVVVNEDVTERVRAQQALAESAARLQHLSRRLLEVVEEERQRIARELHDEVGQLLTGLRMLLGPKVAPHAGEPGAEAEQARAIVDELLERIRALSFDLRPAALDQLGLLPALLALFERFSQQTGVQVQFRHQGVERRFAPDVETAAYRVVQEALTNVARHAGTPSVIVRVWASEDRLSVQVEDRGRGFDPEVARVSSRSSGLVGMQERVELLAGSLVVESAKGAGTQITAELPLAGPRREP